MNTYHAVQLDTGRWAVEWFAEGKSQGFLPGTYTSEAEAAFAAYELARREMKDRPR